MPAWSPDTDRVAGGLPCQVEVASEYRYFIRALPNTLVVAISQSGETMDTLAALEHVNSERALSAGHLCGTTAQWSASDGLSHSGWR